jgi:hypothetical protein
MAAAPGVRAAMVRDIFAADEEERSDGSTVQA